jgi:hypothetical protein
MRPPSGCRGAARPRCAWGSAHAGQGRAGRYGSGVPRPDARGTDRPRPPRRRPRSPHRPLGHPRWPAPRPRRDAGHPPGAPCRRGGKTGRRAPPWPCGSAPAGEPAPTLEVPASRQSPWGLSVGRVVQVRPLPSDRVVLSRPYERYYGPLRLPGQPGATSGSALIRHGVPPVGCWSGSPVVPCATVRACHPCYPGGSGPVWQLW